MVQPHTKRIPLKTIAAVALMRSGLRDHAEIARAVGLTDQQVAQIDLADSPAVRQLALEGIPEEFSYRLRAVVRCPHCHCRINVAPCMTCKIRSAAPEEEELPL